VTQYTLDRQVELRSDGGGSTGAARAGPNILAQFESIQDEYQYLQGTAVCLSAITVATDRIAGSIFDARP